ncbi:MAG: YbgC/FadM family acyl-CoA thioesterase [Acetobacter sp.]|nr:YbgC/FadM family acyl-CoA thioesterase [Acetobacter sp.]
MSAHSIQFRVYYEDTDANGIVYHARYLAFAERARTEAIRSLGCSVLELANEHKLVFVVRDITLSCKKPLRLDDIFSVHTVLTKLGTASCDMKQTIVRDLQICAIMNVRLGCVHLETNCPTKFPTSWYSLLQKLNCHEEEYLSALHQKQIV